VGSDLPEVSLVAIPDDEKLIESMAKAVDSARQACPGP